MSQISEIPAFAYTPEMETLGALPDVPTFDGELVPMSRNPLTPGMRPLQLLPLLGTEFPVRYETSRMRGFQAEFVHAPTVASRRRLDFALKIAREQHKYSEIRLKSKYCVPSTVVSCSCSLEEQLRNVTVHQRGKALSSCVMQLSRCVAHLHRCEAHLFLGQQTSNSCVTQLWSGVVRLLRCATQLCFKVDLGKARSGGSATNASAFWVLLGPPMRARVVAAGFGDYAAGLRCTQPRFPPTMRYALMERWNDCTHTFVFGFDEMTLTPVDYAAIIGLCPVPPLDAWYQTATLGAQLVRSLLGVTTQTRYTVQGYVSYEVVFWFWAERIRTRLV
ncbi:hypothetical protein JCGZ_20118 [Jatropha curcas]|uniref:Aminotransferase-like plant mobile domain-containing protein n=1 Tax=Jatropha curcas TaxID=180498 RepID=A0A067JU91_JATCU|nr:hypothetical protein JCGZ_20118 [Jatropha curcas]